MAAARGVLTLRGRLTLVGINYFDSNEAALARRGASLSRSRFPCDILLPFNDADEVSCRAGAIKCSRCRASFAPIFSAFAKQKLVPPQDRQPIDPFSENKELTKVSDGWFGQSSNQRFGTGN